MRNIKTENLLTVREACLLYTSKIYQARYLSGIAAGLKTKTNLLGYVAAKPFAEVISGYTAFYLGAKSVNDDVKMVVKYTGSWLSLIHI